MDTPLLSDNNRYAAPEAHWSEERKSWDWVLEPPNWWLPDGASRATRRDYFGGLIERCVLVEPLSPWISPQTLQEVLDQLGVVHAIKLLRTPLYEAAASYSDFRPNYSRKAIVELRRSEKAKELVDTCKSLLMIGGIPRPVGVRHAEPDMLIDHPCNRGRVYLDLRIFPRRDCKLFRQYLLFCDRALSAEVKIQQEEEEALHAEQVRDLAAFKKRSKSYLNASTQAIV
ncbi:uncharacterized protein [Physcomitrium patens]|uniref:RRM domain-containing protein n=1 Tax=Physcomitrium patens TaxID=3218 RepID=A0A2K1IIH3_PHYPA|nr:uncharacterized protein LOC112275569 isoform X1 [Physcomitrium patens]XP_024361810.1 uncharacterized protein LOC112275569 isoform X1 [Physcomitrium patens]PNR29082.1 hypothetical protein PHYPA_027774 [Physcomitrium patens]|eukprot:XP_024361809.1 uncharacterized protein LOC112275569 isoform X1 [Physcomitrella patens]